MIRAIVTDIEGTTSSLSFVKDTLFPYARAHLAAFIQRHRRDPEVARLLEDAQAVARKSAHVVGDKSMGESLTEAQLLAQLQRWIDEDQKVMPLKALQGLIWEQGYRDGTFQGHVYEDAVRNLKRWQAAGIALFVFSSGSVQAQKLLFAHTAFGDLTPLFKGYFDPRIGAKREPAAYRAIAAAIALPEPAILFLSDIQQELDAAAAAGLATVWLMRDGPLTQNAAHRQVRDFDAIKLS